MPRLKLTSAAIEKLKSSTGKRQEYFDKLLPGLALRVTKHGCKSWVLFYRPQGRLKRATLGRYPILSLIEARNKARQLLQERYAHNYPHQFETRTAYAVSKEPQKAFNTTFDEFIERYAKPNNKTWKETERLIEKVAFPHWKHKKIETITKRDVVRLLDSIVDSGAPVLANLTFAHIRKFFNWCLERSYIEKSPCEGLKAPTKVTSRDRVLTDDEVKAIWLACDQLFTPAGDFIKTLLLTGQRRGEVAGIKWDEINNDIWTIPSDRTKNAHEHIVPLPLFVQKHITKNNNISPFAFTTTGTTPISGFSKIKKQLDKASGVANWRIHDLRRTAATGMAKLKVSPHVIEKVLNHRSGEIKGVAAVYNRHAYTEECREALETWANYIKSLCSETSKKI